MIQIRQKTNKQKVLKGTHLPIVLTIETLLVLSDGHGQYFSGNGQDFCTDLLNKCPLPAGIAREFRDFSGTGCPCPSLASTIANDQVPCRGRHFVSLNNNGAVMSHGSLD